MRESRGFTLLELVTVMAVMSVLAAVAVPAAASLSANVAGGVAARRLALVVRVTQSHAQSRGVVTRLSVGGDGRYTVAEAGGAGALVMDGSLSAPVSSNYPGGVVEFAATGRPCLPGSTSPRAGHFDVGSGARSKTVVVQLSGCVRCE